MQKKWTKKKHQKEISARISSPNNIMIARSMVEVLLWYAEKHPEKTFPYLEATKEAARELSSAGGIHTPSSVRNCTLHRKKNGLEVGFTLEVWAGSGWYGSSKYITVRLDGMPPVVTEYEVEAV